MDASLPLNTKNKNLKLRSNGNEISNTNFRNDGRNKIYDWTNCQSRNEKDMSKLAAIALMLQIAMYFL